MGLGGFRLEASAVTSDATVTLQPTGQRFALAGTPAPAPSAPAWRVFKVIEWPAGAPAKLEVISP